MREGKLSTTSTWVAALRGLYTYTPGLGTAHDPIAQQLVTRRLAGLLGSIRQIPSGTTLAHRLLGLGTLGLSYNVALRSRAIDEVIQSALSRGIQQVVILGAGLDARAWRLACLATATVYEIDHPATQAYKRACMHGESPLSQALHYVSVDFEKDDLTAALTRSGFDSAAPSVWLWEGVTMYLSQAAIDETLAHVRQASAPRSLIAFTYVVPSYGPLWIRALGQIGSRVIGETLRGAMSPPEVAQKLTKLDFQLSSDETAEDWAFRYWPKSEARRVRAWEHLAVAERQ